jgi:hypothetical protein
MGLIAAGASAAFRTRIEQSPPQLVRRLVTEDHAQAFD